MLGREIDTPSDILPLVRRVRGNQMGLRRTPRKRLWASSPKRRAKPLHQLLGGSRDRVSSRRPASAFSPPLHNCLTASTCSSAWVTGVSRKIEARLGSRTAQPCVRATPDILLMGDANSAFTLDDIAMLQQLDDLDC